jgi:uncharacterized membrane protein YdjX (TVP38/TMEM64 family)
MRPGSAIAWFRVIAGLALFGLIVLTWNWLPENAAAVQQSAASLRPHRHAWYALPLVAIAFTVLGLALVPVVLLIALTGIVFGPILGPIYAMAGSLASASAGFVIGRRMGRARVDRLGGDRIARVTRTLQRNGTLAVFLVRKIPAPFTLVNIVAGASRVSYRDFVVGTVLGMAAFIVALAGFGYSLARAVQDPTPTALLGAALFVGVPLTLAWLINRWFKRRGSDA